MAKNEKVRLSPEIQQADENTFLALKAIAGYSPANPAYSPYLYTQLIEHVSPIS